MEVQIREDILERALEKWGVKFQMLKTVEEASELISAIMHFIDGRIAGAALADEVADVIIMAAQMRIACGKEAVDTIIAAKIDRLSWMLKDNEDKKE